MRSTESIDDYLDELAGLLAGSTLQSQRFLAETEAHLRDARDNRAAQGDDPARAESEAIRAFGTPQEVARAANQAGWRTVRRSVARAAVGLGLRLVAVGMLVIGVAGGVTRLVASFGLVNAMYGLPADVVTPASKCTHWLAVQPTAATCQQAATLEAADDLTGVYLVIGVVGLLLAITLLITRRHLDLRVLPATLGPSVSAATFGAAAAGLLALGLTNAVISTTWGRGMWLTDAAFAFLAFAGSILLLVRALRFGNAARPALGPVRQ